MGTNFADFMKEIEDEARAEGPEAVAELEAFRTYFKSQRDIEKMTSGYLIFDSYPKDFIVNALRRVKKEYPAVYRNFFLAALEEEIKENG